jgi:aminoglycoside phosphotransferase
MISDLAGYAEKATEGAISAENASIISIKTTHEIFLVFTEDDSSPACVISIGKEERMQHLRHVLGILNKALPNSTPEPLSFDKLDKDQYILVQSGLPGTPWFQLSRRIKNKRGWIELFTRSLESLRQFQSAVRAIPEWRAEMSPGNELRRVAAACGHIELPDSCEEQVTHYVEILDKLGEFACYSQHGDFCLNNLLFSDGSASIIDFDEFGLTSMPYHDEFMLAHSFNEVSGGDTGHYPGDLLEYLLNGEYSGEINSPPVLQGLYLYHLFYRLMLADSLQQRQDLKPTIISTIGDFLAKPNQYIPPNKLG